jgi:plastocyanin domain-containing protein
MPNPAKHLPALLLPVLLATSGACAKKNDDTKAASMTSQPSAAPAAVPADGKLAVRVTEKGFEPDGIQVKKDTPYTFTFTRTTDKTCGTEVILQLGGGKSVEKKLPLNEPVVLDATFTESGKLAYACAMDHVKGVVTVE